MPRKIEAVTGRRGSAVVTSATPTRLTWTYAGTAYSHQIPGEWTDKQVRQWLQWRVQTIDAQTAAADPGR
jgi:hypothetical protein